MIYNLHIKVVHASRISLKSLAQYYKRTLKVVLLKHVCYTHLIASYAWCGVEACGRSHHYGLTFVREFLKAPAAELLAVVYWQLSHDANALSTD